MLVPVLICTMSSCFLFGWLSDKVGRKPLVMVGLLLSASILYPFCMAFTHFGNPELESAMKRSPAVVVAEPKECSFQFVPSELKKHMKLRSSCDILKNLLNQYSVSYSNEAAPQGSLVVLKIGNETISSPDTANLTASF